MREYKKGKENPNFRDRIGEIHTMNNGHTGVVVEYLNADNCTLEFEDGVRLYKKTYSQICGKTLRKPNDRVGHQYINHQGYTVEVLESPTYHNCTVKFHDKNSTILKKVSYGNVSKGTISNPYHPTLFDKGYVGVGKYNGKNLTNKEHRKWQDIFKRCYSDNFLIKNPSYNGCHIDDVWNCLQDFGAWYEKNWKPHMDNTWELDKDILVKGNKIYSPETCCFVPHAINTLFIKSEKVRGEYPIGVSSTRSGKFRATVNKYGVSVPLGTFDTIEEAFIAYKIAKEAYIKEVAEIWKDRIDPKVYKAIYNYKVEITD